MSPHEQIRANDLGSARLNVVAFLLQIDDRYDIKTVNPRERAAVEEARRIQGQHLITTIGDVALEADSN